MRTNEFINTLVADHAAQSPPKPIAYRLVMALVGGFAISAALLLITLGVRPDIMAALGTWRFDLKLGGSLLLVIAASWVALRLSRPTTRSLSVMPALLVPTLLLFVGVVYELVTVPASSWTSLAMGANGVMCLANIMASFSYSFGDGHLRVALGRPNVSCGNGGGGRAARGCTGGHSFCNTLHRRLAAVRGDLVCASNRSRVYVWPSDREARTALVASRVGSRASTTNGREFRRGR